MILSSKYDHALLYSIASSDWDTAPTEEQLKMAEDALLCLDEPFKTVLLLEISYRGLLGEIARVFNVDKKKASYFKSRAFMLLRRKYHFLQRGGITQEAIDRLINKHSHGDELLAALDKMYETGITPDWDEIREKYDFQYPAKRQKYAPKEHLTDEEREAAYAAELEAMEAAHAAELVEEIGESND